MCSFSTLLDAEININDYTNTKPKLHFCSVTMFQISYVTTCKVFSVLNMQRELNLHIFNLKDGFNLYWSSHPLQVIFGLSSILIHDKLRNNKNTIISFITEFFNFIKKILGNFISLIQYDFKHERIDPDTYSPSYLSIDDKKGMKMTNYEF